MAWKEIIGASNETLEARKVVIYATDELSKKYKMMHGIGVFQVSLYKFIKILRTKFNVPPDELITIFMNNPDYLEYVYRVKFKELRELILQSSKTDDNRIRIFVMLYYDNWFKYKSFIKTIRIIKKYPYDTFNKKFMKEVFKRYPFLLNKNHLEHVTELLNEVTYGYNIINEKGIKEFYT